MPVGGAGGLLGNLFFPGLDDRLALHMSPNPNPLAQQGGPVDPKAVDSLGNAVPAQQPNVGNLPPGAFTQPDPVNSSYAKDLLAASRRDANAQMFNEGLDQMTASFGTAQQQASKQNALRHGGGVGGSLADLASIQKMQDTTIADNEHARFMSNAAVFAQTLRAQGINVTDAQAMEIMNGGKEMTEQFSGAAAGAGQSNATQTQTQKDAEAATREWAKANPNATPQQIADYKANLMAGGMGGSDLEQRQYLSERSTALAAGQKDFPDYATWKAQKTAEATTLATTAKEEAENKVAAGKELPFVEQTLSKSEGIIKRLLANKQATIDAINTMPSKKEGWWAANTRWGASEEVRTQSGLLKELMSSLAGDNLKTVKNLRNRQEFQTLADSITARLQAGSTDEGIESSLNELLQKMGETRSIAREQAGMPAEEGKKDGGGSGGAEQPPMPNAKKAPDGHWYVPDPDKPGKYQRVDQ